MKWLYISLYCLVLANCTNKINEHSTIFSDERLNQWEKVTNDTINSIYEQNKGTKIDTFELNQLGFFRTNLFNHLARPCFIESVKADKLLLNSRISNFIIIESKHESNMNFIIILNMHNKKMFLSYKYTHLKNAFVIYNRGIIDDRKLQSFIEEVKKSDLFKNKNYNGEYYNGDIIVSFFSKNKVEVFPYLTFNFSNEIFRSYNEMFK